MVQDECVRLADEAGALRVVGYLYDAEVPKAVAGVRLIFDHGDWVVTVDEDDDTIELAETTDKVLDRWQIAEASSFFPWAAAIGKTVRWAWTLENQQGYLDALQLELASTSRGGSVGIQLVAMASHLAVHAVIPIETPYLAPPTAS